MVEPTLLDIFGDRQSPFAKCPAGERRLANVGQHWRRSKGAKISSRLFENHQFGRRFEARKRIIRARIENKSLNLSSVIS